MAFRLFSNDFNAGGTLPMKQVLNGFGHHGDNQSPHLSWEDAPDGTKSFVVTMYDPDAPTGSGLWHWVAIDLPASIHELPAGAGSGTAPLPAGSRQTRNDLGAHEYAGAAPPAGPAHRYVYTVRPFPWRSCLYLMTQAEHWLGLWQECIRLARRR